MENRYARQTMLPQIGEEGQRRLSEASVLVVGVGGLGSAVSLYLTAAGVGRIGLVDDDRVSLTNLQRQVLYTEAEVGIPKTACAERRLRALSSHTRFDRYDCRLTAENADSIVAQYDLVVDGCDNFATRYLIDDTCSRLGKPWVHGSIGEFHGQVSVFNHILRRHYSELYPDRDALCALPRVTAGVVGAVPGVIGAIQANEALKILACFGTPCEGKLFTIDLLTLQTSLINY